MLDADDPTLTRDEVMRLAAILGNIEGEVKDPENYRQFCDKVLTLARNHTDRSSRSNNDFLF